MRHFLDAIGRASAVWSTGFAVALMVAVGSLLWAAACWAVLMIAFAVLGWPMLALDDWLLPTAFIWLPFGAGTALPFIRDLIRERSPSRTHRLRA